MPSTLTFDGAGKLKDRRPVPPRQRHDLDAHRLGAGYGDQRRVGRQTARSQRRAVSPSTWATSPSTTRPATATRRLTDGYATGQITGLKIDGNGVLFATFSNQQSKAIGQISLASFNNEQGLQPAGGTTWRETFASGQPGYDTPQAGTLGSIVANSLENSNVNLTNELVDLIKAQSNYQANAKTISTQSTIMQTIIQMT